MSISQLRREIAKLNNRLDRTTSNYTLARSTLDKIEELEQELEYRLSRFNSL